MVPCNLPLPPKCTVEAVTPTETDLGLYNSCNSCLLGTFCPSPKCLYKPLSVKGLVQLRRDQEHPSYLRLVPSYAPSMWLVVATARCGLADTWVGAAGVRATQHTSSSSNESALLWYE